MLNRLVLSILMMGTPALADPLFEDGERREMAEALLANPCSSPKGCRIKYGSYYGQILVTPFDINGDNKSDYIVINERSCGAGNCATAVFIWSSNGYRLVWEGFNFHFVKQKTKGFFDIIGGYKGPGFESLAHCFNLYKWDGVQYVLAECAIIKP